MAITDSRQRLKILRELLTKGELSTQEELVQELHSHKFKVTQSTISRDLRKIGAMKTIDGQGRTIYKLSDAPFLLPVPQQGMKNLILGIQNNGYMIVIQTSPGSASLVARQLDTLREEGILGTLAGDDTVFVAPASVKKIDHLMKVIQTEFGY